ncbi:MAG: IclR family transcriptional regulator [Burkholderiaceae bacterium]
MDPADIETKDGAQTVHRIAALLRVLKAAGQSGRTAAELAEQCGLTRSTAHRLLAALKSEGLIAQPPGGRHYHLGPQLYELGLVAPPTFGMRELCCDLVSRLSESANATCLLTLRSGLDGVCVDRVVAGPECEVLKIEIGYRRPLGVGLGSIAILAALPAEESEAVMRANGMRYRDWNKLGVNYISSMVQRTRRNGYAFTANDYIDSVGGFALAIRAPDTQVPFAAVSLASRVDVMPPSRMPELLPQLQASVETIEARLRQRMTVSPCPPTR